MILGGLSFSGCSEEEDATVTPDVPEAQTCLITSITSDIWAEGNISFTYDETGKPNQVTITDGENSFVDAIIFDDQNRLRSFGEESDSSYYLFEYNAQEIRYTFHYTKKDGSRMTGDRQVYETNTSGRVVSRSEYYYSKESSEFVKESTDTYTYDEAGNVVKITAVDMYKR